jgi:hypothetical protein
MGQTYSSTKPINRLYRNYMQSTYEDLDDIGDIEWINELRKDIRNAIQRISPQYVEHLDRQLDVRDTPHQEPLVSYYMKKFILAISAKIYIQRVRKMDEHHTDIARYQSILDRIFTTVRSTRLTRHQTNVRRTNYTDKFLYESALDKLMEKHFTAEKTEKTAPTTYPKRQASATRIDVADEHDMCDIR